MNPGGTEDVRLRRTGRFKVEQVMMELDMVSVGLGIFPSIKILNIVSIAMTGIGGPYQRQDSGCSCVRSCQIWWQTAG